MGRGASAGGAAVPGLPLTAGTDYRMVLGQTFRDGAEKGASRDTSGQNGATAGAEPNRSRKRKRREPTDPAEATFTELACGC